MSRKRLEKGLIQVYTGDGKGKTTAALGLALRAVGHNYRVYVIQFLKGERDCGELHCAQELLSDHLTIKPMGRCTLINKKNPDKEDIEWANLAFQLAKELIFSKEYDIVVLDELNVAVDFGLLPLQGVLDLLEKKPDKVELVLTGRYAHPEIMAKADLVTEMVERKHYYQKGVKAREGIEK